MLRFSHRPPPPDQLRHVRHDHDADVQYQLGLESLRGGSSKDSTRLAAHCLRLAASQGHAKAEYLVAVMAKEGEGMPPCAHKYVKFLTRAAMHGQREAQLELGRLYAKGSLVEKDLVRSRRLFQQAVYNKSVDACKELARLAAAGGRRDVDEALVWWEKAAKSGDAEALFEASRLHIAAGGDVQLPRGVELLRRSAQSSHPEALWALGDLLREPGNLGGSVRRDCAKAAACLAQACEVWRNQAEGLQRDKTACEKRSLRAMAEFDHVLETWVPLQRCFLVWCTAAQRRRQVLERCLRHCIDRSKRSMFASLVARAAPPPCERIYREDPLGTSVSLVRVLAFWRLYSAAAARRRLRFWPACRNLLGKQRFWHSLCRAALRAWALRSATRRAGCAKLAIAVGLRLRRIVKGSLGHWRLVGIRDAAAARLARCLHRMVRLHSFVPSFGMWCRHSADARVCASADQQLLAEQRLLELQSKLTQLQDSNARKIAALQKRHANEKVLNSQLEDLNRRTAFDDVEEEPLRDSELSVSVVAPVQESATNLPGQSSSSVRPCRHTSQTEDGIFSLSKAHRSSASHSSLIPDLEGRWNVKEELSRDSSRLRVSAARSGSQRHGSRARESESRASRGSGQVPLSPSNSETSGVTALSSSSIATTSVHVTSAATSVRATSSLSSSAEEEQKRDTFVCRRDANLAYGTSLSSWHSVESGLPSPSHGSRSSSLPSESAGRRQGRSGTTSSSQTSSCASSPLTSNRGAGSESCVSFSSAKELGHSGDASDSVSSVASGRSLSTSSISEVGRRHPLDSFNVERSMSSSSVQRHCLERSGRAPFSGLSGAQRFSAADVCGELYGRTMPLRGRVV